MNAFLDLFNASAAITSQPMQVPPIVSSRSRKTHYNREQCEYGYEWRRFGCLRAIYRPVQKPGSIRQAFGLPNKSTTHKPYTLPIAVDKYTKENDSNKFGVWPVNKPFRNVTKPKKRTTKQWTEPDVIIVGDIDEHTSLPENERKWRMATRKVSWKDINPNSF